MMALTHTKQITLLYTPPHSERLHLGPIHQVEVCLRGVHVFRIAALIKFKDQNALCVQNNIKKGSSSSVSGVIKTD